MRDELDGRMWADNHDQFSAWVNGALGALRSALSRLSTWDGSTHQLFALVAAFAVTALTFNGTAT